MHKLSFTNTSSLCKCIDTSQCISYCVVNFSALSVSWKSEKFALDVQAVDMQAVDMQAVLSIFVLTIIA